jgi:isopenicillin N synthase-like dioxygenase
LISFLDPGTFLISGTGNFFERLNLEILNLELILILLRTMTLEQTIPVVDLNLFTMGSPSNQRQFIEAVGQALKDIGFFAVVNHGVDPELIARAYQVTQSFFELSEEVKGQYTDPALKGQRGFTPFGIEHAKDHAWPDLKEFWHVGRETSSFPNLKPREVPEFHPTLSLLYTQLEDCAQTLLQSLALYLEEPIELLSQMIVEGDTILRIIHYPALPPDAPVQSMRAAPHEDINLITLLCEATAPGLELLQRDGSWLPIQALPGQIIVDAGDMLQQLTNGLFKSTTHRVTNPTQDRERRFSMPFFVHPRQTVDLSPLARCIALTGGKPLFPKMTAGDYLHQRLQEIGLA